MKAIGKSKKKKNSRLMPGGKEKTNVNEAKLKKIYHHSEDVVARVIEGELILVPLVAGLGNLENEIYALDETGKEIWNQIDGKKTVAKIVVNLVKKYSSAEATIGRDVIGLLDELGKRKFILEVSR